MRSRYSLLRLAVILACLGAGPAHAQLPGLSSTDTTSTPSLDDMMSPPPSNTPSITDVPENELGSSTPLANGATQINPKDLEPGTYILRSANGPPMIFVPSTPENLSKSFIKLSGADLNDDVLLDDYASVNLCPLFMQYSDDEFAWRDARKAIRRHIERNIEKFPEYIAFDSRVKLDRYDFGIQAFRLKEQSRFVRTGRFSINTRVDGKCTRRGGLTRIPSKYSIRLSNPIMLDAIPLKEERAYRVLNDMKNDKNNDRIVYVTFFIRINDYSANMVPSPLFQQGKTEERGEVVASADARATLVSLRFYEDEDHTRILYEYQPETTNPFDE